MTMSTDWQPPSGASVPPVPTRRRKRRWPKVIAALVGLFVAIGIIGAIAGGGDDSTNETTAAVTAVDGSDDAETTAVEDAQTSIATAVETTTAETSAAAATVEPTTEQATTPTVPPTPAPIAGASRANPVPLGQPLEVEDWTIVVTGYAENADATYADADEYADPPPAGTQYAIVQFSGTYNGPDSDTFPSYYLSLLGESSLAAEADILCTITVNEENNVEVFTGGTLTTNLCYQLAPADAATAVVAAKSSEYGESTRFMAVR